MNKILKLHITGIIFTVFFGILLHYFYNWSGENPVVAIFSPVNESVWEHLKLLFFPMMIFAVIECSMYGKCYKNFIPVKALSPLMGMLTVVVIFYTSTGAIGESNFIISILIFIAGVIVSYVFSYKNLKSGDRLTSKKVRIFGWILIFLLFISFAVFTFNPPEIGLFKDPVTNQYGII